MVCVDGQVGVQVCVDGQVYVDGQNSPITSHSLSRGLALFSSAPVSALWWIKGVPAARARRRHPGVLAQAAALGLGHWAPWECVVFDGCSEYLVAASLFKCETMRFIRSGGGFLFTQKNHRSYSWFWSLIRVLMCWCPCPGVNVAWKNLVGGWLVGFSSSFLVFVWSNE